VASSSSGGPPDADDDGGEDAVFDGCDAVDNLATIAVLGDRLTNAAGHCSVDEFARYRRALESVEPVNRNLDRLVDALRKDELREKTCAADARRLVDVVAHLVVDCIEGGVGGGGGENEADGGGAEDPRRQGKSGGAGEEDAKREIEGQLASSADEAVARTAVMHCQLDSAALCLDTMRSMVERVLRGGGGGGEEQQQQQEGREPAVVAAAAPLDEGGEDGDEGVASTATPSGYAPAPTTHNDDPEERRLGAQFASRVEAASYQTRVAKVAVGKVARALEEYQQRSLGLRRDVDARGRLGAAAAMTAELAAAAREAGLALHQVLHGGEPGRTRPRSHAEMQAHVDFLTTYTATAAELTAEAARLAEACAELANYHEFSRGVAPWELRSQQARLLQLVPEKTEQELRQARDALREAQKRAREEKEASEIAALRIAHLQSRMADEKEVARQMDEFKAQIASMTTQNAGLKEDRMKQDKELQALEADRDKWQKIAGDSRAFADGMDAADLRAGQERAAAAAAHMDALKDEILGLESAVRHLREDNRRARTTEQAAYDWLSEPRSGGGAAGGGTTTATRESSSRKRRRGAVAAESRNALAELVRIATAPGVGVVSLAAAFGAAPSAGDGRDEQEAAEVDRLAWRPARVAPRHVVARRAEEYAAWMDWRAGVLKKGDALARDSAARGLQRVAGREAVARLQIRLPGGAAGGDKGVRTGGGVSVVGSAEWEALQGRVVV
jgi:dynactin 1